MKKVSLILLPFFMAASVFADAQEKAVELMKLMEIRKNMEASKGQLMQFSSSMIDSQGLSAEEARKAKAAAGKSTAAAFDAMSQIDWEGMFASVYAKVFTEEELQGLLDFYQSPVGQKFLDKQPELTAATMQKMQLEMAKVMPQIQQTTMQAITEAKAAE
ncbi:MAG: DUF2059 domain-containing protein [Coraliomargarita sp.]